LNSSTAGILSIVSACIIWGFAPIYYKLLVSVPPFELLSHRTLWSFVFFFAVLGVKGRLNEFKTAVFNFKGQFPIILLASLLIAINWFFFIFAIQTNQTTEASLGYFMMPLVAVVWGLLIFREKLSIFQWLSVLLAAVAVCILTFGLGVPPWIALILSFSFSIYAVIKKKLKISPIVSVTGEVFVLIPVSLLLLLYFHSSGQGSFGGDWTITVLLASSGPLTAAPLILFSYGTQKVNLSTAGILQYLNPSLQFFCAAYIFMEPLSIWHTVAFPLIWAALIIYSWVGIKKSRAI
jgi:chloramphenicol-sensitive protein RarD